MVTLPRIGNRGGGPETVRRAFVLSGGGNQAVAQVGMLQALLERGIVPDVVVGTSAGAINGAAVAADPTPEGVERLAEVWRGLRGDLVFPGSRFSRAWNVLRRSTHLFSNEGVRQVIDLLPAERFDELAVPLRVVATDLGTGEEVVFASGPLQPALLASCALPGLYPPVEHDGRRLVDGGVVNNVPLRHALAGPVDEVFVLNVSGGVSDGPIRYPLDVVLRAFAIARGGRYELERQMAPPGVEIVEFPRPEDGRSLFDFSGSDTLMEEAYALASRHLDQLAPRPQPRPEPTSLEERSRRRWFRRLKRVAEVA